MLEMVSRCVTLRAHQCLPPQKSCATDIAVGAILLAVAACGSADGVPADVRVMRIADTVIVTNPPVSDEQSGQLAEIDRLGQVEGPDSLLLSGWIALTVGHRGEAYVADAAGLRMLSRDGGSARWLARWGQGPGEVGQVSALRISSDGRLAVLDIGNRRVMLLDTSGVVLHHWRLPIGLPGLGPSAIVPLDRDRMLVCFSPSA